MNKKKKIIIGTSVGVSVAVLSAIIATSVILAKKNNDNQTEKPNAIQKTAIEKINLLSDNDNEIDSSLTLESINGFKLKYNFYYDKSYKLKITLTNDLVRLVGSNLNFKNPKIEFSVNPEYQLDNNILISKLISADLDKIKLELIVKVSEAGYKSQEFKINFELENKFASGIATQPIPDINKNVIKNVVFYDENNSELSGVLATLNDDKNFVIDVDYNSNKKYKLSIELRDDLQEIFGSMLGFSTPSITYTILEDDAKIFNLENNRLNSKLLEPTNNDFSTKIELKISQSGYKTQSATLSLNFKNKYKPPIETIKPTKVLSTAISKFQFLNSNDEVISGDYKPTIDEFNNLTLKLSYHFEQAYKLKINLTDNLTSLVGSKLNFINPNIDYSIENNNENLFSLIDNTLTTNLINIEDTKDFSVGLKVLVTEDNYLPQEFKINLQFVNTYKPPIETQKPIDINKSIVESIKVLNDTNNTQFDITDIEMNQINFEYNVEPNYQIQLQLSDDIVKIAGSKLGFNQPQIKYTIENDQNNLFSLNQNTLTSTNLKDEQKEFSVDIKIEITEMGYKPQSTSFKLNFKNTNIPKKPTTKPNDINASAITELKFFNDDDSENSSIKPTINDIGNAIIKYNFLNEQDYKLKIKLADNLQNLAGSMLGFDNPQIAYKLMGKDKNLFNLKNNLLTSEVIKNNHQNFEIEVQTTVVEEGYLSQTFSFKIQFHNEFRPPIDTTKPNDVNKTAIQDWKILNAANQQINDFRNKVIDSEVNTIQNDYILGEQHKLQIKLTDDITKLTGSKLGFNQPKIKYSLDSNENGLFSIEGNLINSQLLTLENKRNLSINVKVEVTEVGYKPQTFNFNINFKNYYSKAPEQNSFKNPPSYEELKSPINTTFGYNYREVIGTKSRVPQTQKYETELMKLYADSHNFVYPGYNRNYEEGNNKYFYDKNGNNPIDAMELVYNERTPTGEKYNDSNWIKNEIAKNNLKKHPAVDNFYANDISNIDVQTVKFQFSTLITGVHATGLYAPPGEVITLTFDDNTWELMKQNVWNDISIVINENFWDNYPSDNSGRISNRYPFIETKFEVDNQTKSIKFGSPFGGAISIRINNPMISKNDPGFSKNALPITFTIDNAIPCIYYEHNMTTENDWEQQKADLVANKIAPALQASGNLYTMNIPSTGINEIGHLGIDKMIYPKEIFDKWDEFFIASNVVSRMGITQPFKLNMEFCDDIWGGAGAWGGGGNLHAPTKWGTEGYFQADPLQVFNPSSSWGLFHEINHTFQQDNAFFKRNTHPETNELSILNYALISDSGRLRSPLNWTGEAGKEHNKLDWSRISSSFIAAKDIRDKLASNVKDTNDEYPIYAQLLFNLGPKHYAEYMMWDSNNHPSNAPNWTGINEIETLSEYFKVNLFPAFFDFEWYWNDWTKQNNLNDSEKEIVNRISAKYKAFDFVGNLFATGIYLFNSELNDFVYGGDFTTPYEVLAGQKTEFDLNKFIISTNPSFNWIDLKYPTTTKTGGTVSFDNKTKKLTYLPNLEKIDEIDEFDISLIPGEWANKPNNYVPEIKFKIKIRQVINQPELQIYNVKNGIFSSIKSRLDELENKKDYIFNQPIAAFNTNQFLNDSKSKRQGAKIKFKFVAPETGRYKFSAKWAEAIKIKVNGKQMFKEVTSQSELKPTFEINFKKNQVIDFEIHTVGYLKTDRFDLKATINNKEVKIIKNSLIPNYQNIVKNQSAVEIVNDKKYQYTPRHIEQNDLPNEIAIKSSINNNLRIIEPFEINPVTNKKTTNYTFESPYDRYGIPSVWGPSKNLEDYGLTYFELWNEDHGVKQAKAEFSINFKKPQKVSSIYFGHRMNNHRQAKATNIKVLGYQPNSIDPIIMYDGKYGVEFNDRFDEFSILNLTTPTTVTKIKVEAYNATYDSIIWQWVRVSEDFYYKKQFVAANGPNVSYTPNWIIKRNDEENLSLLNNAYAISKQAGDAIQINLKDVFSFELYGQVSKQPTKIDIFIDGKKINFYPIELQANSKIDNKLWFSHFFSEKKDCKIEIVHLDDNPLYFNFATFH